uniref:Uncharacterized protein n=1 Tax=Arundo donax TaxID=35708 RepID=A0A0A8Y524_ARUDO
MLIIHSLPCILMEACSTHTKRWKRDLDRLQPAVRIT